jgi:hypothetical protein
VWWKPHGADDEHMKRIGEVSPKFMKGDAASEGRQVGRKMEELAERARQLLGDDAAERDPSTLASPELLDLAREYGALARSRALLAGVPSAALTAMPMLGFFQPLPFDANRQALFCAALAGGGDRLTARRGEIAIVGRV